jgi:hypothetical protein
LVNRCFDALKVEMVLRPAEQSPTPLAQHPAARDVHLQPESVGTYREPPTMCASRSTPVFTVPDQRPEIGARFDT